MPESRKIVLKVQLNCQKCKQRALTTAAGIEGVDFVSVDKDSQMTVRGEADPVSVACSLPKYGYADIVSVESVKQPPESPKPEPPKDPPMPQPPTFLVVRDCTYFSEEDPNSCVIS